MTSRVSSERHINLIKHGIALQRSGRFSEAENCYQSVLRENPNHPDALNLMGVLAIEASKYSTAVDYMRRAVAIDSKAAIYRNNLGYALIVSGSAGEAIPHLEKAIALHPRYPDALCNLARAQRILGRVKDAQALFRRALAIDENSLRAMTGLAELDAEHGEIDTAVATFRSVLHVDPRNIDALIGLSQALNFQSEDREIELIEALLADPLLPANQRAPLHHAMGKILNDLGRSDEAMAHYVRGKEIRSLKFSMEHHRKTYVLLKETFSKSFFASRAGFGSEDPRPTFIVGMPRTGTTLAEQIISGHPNVHGLGELPQMREIAGTLNSGESNPESFSAAVARLDPGGVKSLAEKYLNAFSQASEFALRVTDKTPHNFEFLGLIALLFPKARIIHCRREPMDTCVACFMQNFDDSHAYTSDLQTLGYYYREYHNLMQHWRDTLPIRIFDLDYEALVADAESVTRQVVEFLAIPWDQGCLDYLDNRRHIATASRLQVRQPIYSTSVKRWKRYDRHLGALKIALGDLFLGE